MKKALLIILGSLVAIALVVYLGLNFFLGSMVASAIRKQGSQLTQTKVELAGAQISPFSGNGTLNGLEVGNPPGWSSDKAFYLGRIHVEVAPKSIFGDHIVVNDLTVEDPVFDYETKFVSSNIGELLRNIESAAGSGKAEKSKTSSGNPIRFEIHRLRVLRGKVAVGVGPAATSVNLPDIDLTEPGEGKAITSDQLAVIIMRNLTNQVVLAAAKSTLKTPGVLGAAAGDSVMKAAQGLKDMLGGSK